MTRPASRHGRWDLPPGGLIPPPGLALLAIFENGQVSVHPATGGGFHVFLSSWHEEDENKDEYFTTRHPIRAEMVRVYVLLHLGLRLKDPIPDVICWEFSLGAPALECHPSVDLEEHRAERERCRLKYD